MCATRAMGRSRLAAFAGARRARLHSADSGRARLIVERLDACTVAYAGQNHSAFQARALRTRLASRLHSALLVKAPEFDADALLERIAKVLGDCLAVGSMNRKTGALTFTGHYAPVGNPSCVVFLDLRPKG